jgi:hypothetical protein
MMKFISVLLLLAFFRFSSVHAQTADSILTLQPEDFFQIVLKNHPVAKQSSLIPQMARQQIVIARGGFDPYFFQISIKRNFKTESIFY